MASSHRSEPQCGSEVATVTGTVHKLVLPPIDMDFLVKMGMEFVARGKFFDGWKQPGYETMFSSQTMPGSWIDVEPYKGVPTIPDPINGNFGVFSSLMQIMYSHIRPFITELKVPQAKLQLVNYSIKKGTLRTNKQGFGRHTDQTHATMLVYLHKDETINDTFRVFKDKADVKGSLVDVWDTRCVVLSGDPEHEADVGGYGTRTLLALHVSEEDPDW